MASKNNPFSPGALICAYLRDSGGDEQDLSVPQQEAAIRAWCDAHGLALSRIFADQAAPGSSVVARSAFLRMIQHFRSPGCLETGLVIWKFSRFARDIDDAQFYKADLRRMGYTVHSLTDDIPQGIDGRFFEAARDWMNEKFLQDLSEDVKRGLAHLVQTYGAMPGTPPTGFMRQPVDIGRRRDGSLHIVHRWVPDPEKWEQCRQAWQMRARHATLAQIHAATHLCGSLNSYTTFFRNPIYRGELHYAGLVIPGYCEALADEITWNAVQAQARKMPADSYHPRRVNSRYLLSGLVHCARCGSPMNGHTIQFKKHPGQTFDYYRCSRAQRRRDCDAEQIPRQALEDLVLATLADEILNPETVKAHQVEIETAQDQEAALIAAERVEVIKRLAHVRRRLANVVETLANVGSSPAMTKKLKELEAEETTLRTDLADLAAVRPLPQLSDEQITAQANRLRELTGAGDRQDELQRMLRGLVARIAIEREGRAVRGLVTYYHPPEVLGDSDGFMSMERCPHRVSSHRHKYSISIAINLQP